MKTAPPEDPGPRRGRGTAPETDRACKTLGKEPRANSAISVRNLSRCREELKPRDDSDGFGILDAKTGRIDKRTKTPMTGVLRDSPSTGPLGLGRTELKRPRRTVTDHGTSHGQAERIERMANLDYFGEDGDSGETQEPPCGTNVCPQAFSHNGDPCVTPDKISQTVLFPDLFDKPLVATFNREQASSDGGGVLLKAAERVYGLVKAFAGCLADKRAPEKVRHTLAELVGQRIFGIACGHPDGNDADHLAEDPIHKLLLGRDPVAGAPWRRNRRSRDSRTPRAAARSTEWHGSWRRASSSDIGAACIGGCGGSPLIWDPTDDRTHGAQQLTFFNGHYDSWCYLPLLAFLTFNDEKEQYLCAAVLRPGKAVAADGTLSCCVGCCRCCGRRFRRLGFSSGSTGACDPGDPRFPGCRTGARLRGRDGQERGVAAACRNPRWPWPARRARPVAEPSTSIPTPATAAGTWGPPRRVVIKAEVVRLKGREPRDNPRFVGTNLLRSSRFVYEWVYCARGDIENRIKELLDGLQIDRTSCCKFLANQLRVLLTAAATYSCRSCGCGRADRLCPHPSDVAARPAAEAGGACRRLRAPHRPASTTGDAPSPRVAAHRARARRPARSVVSAPRGSAHVSVPGGTAVPAELSPNLASATARAGKGHSTPPAAPRCHVREAPLAVNKPRRCLILDPHE